MHDTYVFVCHNSESDLVSDLITGIYTLLFLCVCVHIDTSECLLTTVPQTFPIMIITECIQLFVALSRAYFEM